LWEAYRRHWGKAGARVLVWQATTEEMHPTVDREFIAEELANDPASAEAEYFARFRTDVAAYIDKEVVEGLVMRGRRELPPVSTITYAGFVDSSGGSSDEMCVAVGHRGPRGEGILDCVRGRLPPFSPDSVVKEFADLLKSYRVLTVIGDKYAGEWPIERFQHHGITYEVAEKNKSQYYVEFLPLLMSGRVELLDNQRMVNQLASLERKTGRGTGRDVVDHPSGHAYHDDLANVCAGVLVEVAGALDGGEETRRYLSGMAGWARAAGEKQPSSNLRFTPGRRRADILLRAVSRCGRRLHRKPAFAARNNRAGMNMAQPVVAAPTATRVMASAMAIIFGEDQKERFAAA